MFDQLSSPITHPEMAWLADLVPLAATVAAILAFTLLFRSRLGLALEVYLARRFSRHSASLDPALRWHPPIISPQRLLAFCLIAVLMMLFMLSRIGPMMVAIALAAPVTALLIWLLLWFEEQRYITRLDGALSAAVGRLEAQLRAGSGFQPALEKVTADIPPGPLHAEWAWFLSRLGQPVNGGSLATATTVCAALLEQTPAPRHATLLGHLEIALEQPHATLVQRVRAAYDAMQAADRRASAMKTELAQMRNTGIVLFLINVGITIYLLVVQHERFLTAYSGTLGMFVAAILVLLMLAPLVGGYLLGRVADMDY